MKNVWATIFKKKTKTQSEPEAKKTPKKDMAESEYYHPALIFNITEARLEREKAEIERKKNGGTANDTVQMHEDLAEELERYSGGEDPRYEQNAAAERLFRSAFDESIVIKVVLATDLIKEADELISISQILHKLSQDLHALKQTALSADLAYYSEEIADLATDLRPSRRNDDDDSSTIYRRTGNVAHRAYIKKMLSETQEIFKTPFYGLIATITNVVFETNHYTPEAIRRMI